MSGGEIEAQRRVVVDGTVELSMSLLSSIPLEGIKESVKDIATQALSEALGEYLLGEGEEIVELFAHVDAFEPGLEDDDEAPCGVCGTFPCSVAKPIPPLPVPYCGICDGPCVVFATN